MNRTSRSNLLASSLVAGRWLLKSTRVVAAGLALLLAPLHALAAVTDCEGLSVDGQAKCIAPTYAPIEYGFCDLGPSTVATDGPGAACRAELGISGPLRSEAVAVAYANCIDKRLASNGSGVTGTVPWLPAGTGYNDGFCYSGPIREVEGHWVWGLGQKSGGWRNWAFRKQELPSCPPGFTPVNQLLRGVSELVRCRPNPPCPPDQEQRTVNDNGVMRSLCLTKVPLPSPDPPSCPRASVGDPIYPLTGSMRQTLRTGVSLGGLELVLTYDTGSKLPSAFKPLALPSFGDLWSSSFHRTLTVGTDRKVVTAHRGNSEVFSFALVGGAYSSEPNVADRLVTTAQGFSYIDARASNVENYDAQGRLTKIELGRGGFLQFTYSASATAQAPAAGYLMQVSDHAGRSLRFEYSLPQGSEVLAATRGLVTGLVDAAGRRATPRYDAGRNLVGFAWPGGDELQFLYENAALPWAMTGRIDENGSWNAAWSYDAGGRAVATSMALGVEAYSVTYDLPPEFGVVETIDVDARLLYQRHAITPPQGTRLSTPNGQQVGWTTGSILNRPVLTGSTQPAGSGCAASARDLSYSVSGNLSSRTDFDRARTCYLHDDRNREILRIEGLAENSVCATETAPNAILPDGARRITTSWHPDWHLEERVVEALRRTTFVYNGRPDPLSGNSSASCTSAPPLSTGSPLPLLCREIHEALLADGSPDPLVPRRTTSHTYDAAGRVLSTTDPMGQSTTYAYWPDSVFAGADPEATGHTAGDLNTMTNARGHVTRFTLYDKAGRVRRSVSPTGITTDLTYTPRAWVGRVEATGAGGASRVTSYEYDKVGQRRRIGHPDGTSTTYGYDEAQRLTMITDARGNKVEYTLDSAGNRVLEEIRDPSGNLLRSVVRAFDELNRMRQMTGGTPAGQPLSATTLSVSPSSMVVVNRPVVLTATIAGANPTGTVTFSSGATVLGRAAVANGKAVWTEAFSTPGIKALTAAYEGSHSPSLDALSLRVDLKAASITSLLAAPAASLLNQVVQLTATVAGNAPGGTVTFTNGGTVLAVVPLANGTAATSTSFSTAATRLLKASYGGDVANSASESSSTSFRTVQGVVTPTVVLTTEPAELAPVDSAVALTATLSGNAPTGTISFTVNSVARGVVPIVEGKATLSTVFPGTGTFQIGAAYGGDLVNNANTAAAISIGIYGNRIATTTQLFECLMTSILGRSAQCGARVEAPVQSQAVAASAVRFIDGQTVRATAAPTYNGVFDGMHRYTAKVNLSGLTLGSHQLRASHSGGISTVPSESAALAHSVVNRVSTYTTLSCDRQTTGVNCSVKVGSPYGRALGPSPPELEATPVQIWKVTAQGSTLLATIPTLRTGPAANPNSPFDEDIWRSHSFQLQLPAGQHEVRATYPGTAVTLPSESAPDTVW